MIARSARKGHIRTKRRARDDDRRWTGQLWKRNRIEGTAFMALTALDPNVALIVVDLQKGIAGLPTVHPMGEVVKRAAALADAFRRRGRPVVLVNVAGGAPGRTEQPPRARGPLPDGWTDFVPELDRQPHDHVVTKRTWGAFTGTDLFDYLTSRGVTQVVVAGVATSFGVESTARQAHECGFNVVLVTDAMSDLSGEAHDNSVKRIFPRLGEIGPAADVIALLETAPA